MSLLAKILIVVQAMLVMTYLGVTSTLYQHKRDWRESYTQLKGRYHDLAVRASDEIAKSTEAVKIRERFADLKDSETNDLTRELERAKSDLDNKSNQLAQRTTDLRGLDETRTVLKTNYDNRQNDARSLRRKIDLREQELSENNNRRGVAEQQVARLKTVTLNLESDVNDLRKEYSDVQRRLREKSLLIAMAEERGVNFATLLAGPPAKLIRGRVSAVKTDLDPTLVVLDVGADDGVEIGYTFSVVRGRQFIAKLIVERVEGTASAARVHFSAEGQSIQPGDNVTTRLP